MTGKRGNLGRRMLYAGLAAGAGVSLVLFELRDLRRAGAIEFWFWVIVGALLALVGTIEFVAAGRDQSKDR